MPVLVTAGSVSAVCACQLLNQDPISQRDFILSLQPQNNPPLLKLCRCKPIKEGKSGYLLLVRGRKLLEIQHSSAWCKQPAACALNAVFPANEAPALVTERSLITVPFLLVVWVPVPHLASYLKQRTRCQDLCLSKLSRDRRRAPHAIALLRAAEEPCAEASRARPSQLQRLTFRWFCHTARYTS